MIPYTQLILTLQTSTEFQYVFDRKKVNSGGAVNQVFQDYIVSIFLVSCFQATTEISGNMGGYFDQ